MIEVRAFRHTDLQSWIDMRCLLWPDVGRDELTNDCQRFIEGKEQLLERVFIASDGDEPIGMIEMSQRNYAEGCLTSPVAYVEAWFVSANYRRKGVGKALVEAGEAWARSLGHTEIASDTDLSNQTSLRSHLRLGFEEAGRSICFKKDL